jgi:hypothetical protein
VVPNEYKYEVGDLVHLNATAFESIPRKLRKHLPKTYKTTLFTIARRTNVADINQYFIPGYDWQGGSGWITEAWISKWYGSGPLQLTVTIDPENDTEEEVAEFTDEIIKQLRKVSEQFGVDFDDLSDVEIKQFEHMVNHLPKVDKMLQG